MIDRPKVPNNLETVIKGLQPILLTMNSIIGNTAEALVKFLHKDKSPEELKEMQEEYYKVFRDTYKMNVGVDPLTNISSGIPTVTSYSRDGETKRWTMNVQVANVSGSNEEVPGGEARANQDR